MLNQILTVVAIIGLVLLLGVAVLQFKKFFFYMLLIKPFIDITVNSNIFGEFNALEISGFLIFVVGLIKYIKMPNKVAIFNHLVIWLFLFFQLLSFGIALNMGDQTWLYGFKLFLKLFNGYFIYFVAANDLMFDNETRIKLYRNIWYTIFIAGLLTIIVYYLGISNSDTTRGLVRYNGLYNDPGTPSYLAVLCLVFASLYKEVQGKKFSDFHKALYYLSWIATIFILYITITKSALLMFIVFLLLWLGVYKKKLFLIFPSVLIGCYISFTNISEVNQRFETEANFIEQGDEESAKSIGTGRVNRWENLFEQFTKDYDLPSKLLGTSHDYAAHNQYLAYLMQIGLLGLSAFILFLFRFLFKTWSLYKKTNDPQIFAGFTICAMYTAYAFTGHPFNYTTLLWYLMIMLGIINVYAKQKSRNTFTIRANENNKFIKPIPAI